jgi:23S rRNA (guanine2445-N2)-methyltransferase / 23S rRNA (guanine2069-N7)-methyltransferase
MQFIVTTSPGLEELLSKEMESLGIESKIESSGAAVRLEGDFTTAAKILTRSRIGSRVLMVLKSYSAKHQGMLYDQTRRVDWKKHFSNFNHTFAVFTHGDTSLTDYNTKFAALKIKDAICDELKKTQGGRPDVDRNNPDIRVEAFLYGGKCEISIDLAGEPLHRRGYRADSGEAPLRENRAAALLMFAGFDGSQKLVDPFCGSGTIAIEAALIAQKRAPGLLKPIEAFAGGRVYPELFRALQKERTTAQGEVSSGSVQILASDKSPTSLKDARNNLSRAGCSHVVKLDNSDARSLRVKDALIVCNPPFGERLLPAESEELLSEFVRQVKHFCSPARLALILQEGDLEKAVGLKPKHTLKIENGPRSAKFLEYEIFEGSLSERKKFLVGSGTKARLKKTASKS